MNRFIWSTTYALSFAAFLTFIAAAPAEYVAQTIVLDQSNRFSDGVKYGSVTIEAYDGVGAPAGGLNAGQVRITYTADKLLSYGDVLFFGINSVGFNTDLAIKKKQIQGPAFWDLAKNEKLDGFGRFTWADSSPLGILRDNPVSILISDLGTDATLDHFLLGSALKNGNPPPQGSSPFAAHVVGLEIGDSTFRNHWIGGDIDVLATPEPASITLAFFALAGIGVSRRLRSRRSQA